MKCKIKALAAGAAAAMFIFLSSAFVYAENFNDVPESHFAYSAINSIASMGIMVGDESGNFNPDKYIDKFDTSKMFAKLLGYKYSDLSDEEKNFYEKAYQNQKSIIEKYSSKFTKWNSSADYEVAFLLEKQFYTEDDLEQFVILSSEGAEQLRALSREEMASFLVRYIGKTAEAEEYSTSDLFADDSSISQSKKKAVYYLRSLGIISGTTDGKFVPKGAVTRADFCYLLDLTMLKTGKAVSSSDTASGSNAIINNVGSISCVVEKYYPSLNILQVNEDGEHKLYKVTVSATVKVNNYLGLISDIPIGAQASIVLNNGEIISIDAVCETDEDNSEPVSEETTEQTTEASNSIVSDDNVVIASSEAEPEQDELTLISGSVTDIGSDSITITYKMIDSLNSIISQSKVYSISSSCKTTKNGIETTVASIEKNDMAEAYVYGSKIYELNLTDISSDEDDDATETIEGYIASLNISGETNAIGISEEKDSDDYTLYSADKSSVPLYELSVGDKIRAHIKNGSVIALTIKTAYDNNSFTGYITANKSDYIVVEYYDGESLKTKKVYYDDDTVIQSGISGKTVKSSAFEEDIRVYVVLSDDEKTAENITIIENV